MLSPSKIAEATGGRLLNPRDRDIDGFSIDTRTINEGEFFIPLPGSRTNGHKFLGDAFEKGAAGALASSREYVTENFHNLVLVENTERALLRMAEFYRDSFHIPIIGVTGSWGKTTTKELTSSILSQTGSVHKSPGNYNTEYGLPLAILEMDQGVDFAVFELGLQYPGDLATLSRVLAPTHGIITGAGKVHLENFTGVDEVARQKLKITEGMDTGSTVLINGDSSALLRNSRGKKEFDFVEYGVEGEADYRYYATDIEIKDTRGLKFSLHKTAGISSSTSSIFPLSLETELNSLANVYNALAAASVSLELGVESSSVVEGVHVDPLPQRLEPKQFPRGIVIDDTYNANPAATRNALNYLSTLDPGNEKIFVVGDMMELGAESSELHKDLASLIQGGGVDRVLGVGQFTKDLVEKLNSGEADSLPSPESEWFESKDSLTHKLDNLLEGEDNLVLVKGSRGMGMEKVVDFLVSECV